MTTPFAKRPLGYRAGLFLLVGALALYITGFSSPNWTTFHLLYSEGSGLSLDDPLFQMSILSHNGLWQSCEKMFDFDMTACGPVSTLHGAPGWISAVQGMQCVGLLGLLLATGYAVVVNFFKQEPESSSRYLEIFIFASGVTGFIGAIIYVSQSSGQNDVITMAADMGDIFYMSHDTQITVDENELSWAFGLNLLGCFMAFIASILFCAFGRLPQAATSAGLSVAVSFSGSRV